MLNLRTMPRDHVASLDKGLQVLTCFDRQHSRLTITETARLTRQPRRASARRALLTLHGRSAIWTATASGSGCSRVRC